MIDRMIEEILPDGFVDVFAILVFHRRATGRHRAVRTFVVAFHIGVGDETAGVLKRRGADVDVHNGSELIQAHHFPGAAVVVCGPATVEDMAETEDAVGRRGGGQRLPGFVIVTGAAEADDAIHFLMLRETCGSRSAM